jgi:hypothetical protein
MQKTIGAIALFVTVLAAQSVFAYYNPATGSWLSRDPIGEPGFQLVQGAHPLSQVVHVRVAQQSSRWINRNPLSGRRDGNLYGFVYNNPITLYDPLGLKVQICCRDINVNPTANCLAKMCGKRHCWLKTDTKQAGMGPADNGPLPSSPCCGTKTAIVDESKETGATCYDIPKADEDCVNNELAIGKPLGDWGANNNCNTFAGQVIKKCGGRNVCLKWTTVCGPDFGFMDICTQWAYEDGP